MARRGEVFSRQGHRGCARGRSSRLTSSSLARHLSSNSGFRLHLLQNDGRGAEAHRLECLSASMSAVSGTPRMDSVSPFRASAHPDRRTRASGDGARRR
jgi:hypothetical protein